LPNVGDEVVISYYKKFGKKQVWKEDFHRVYNVTRVMKSTFNVESREKEDNDYSPFEDYEDAIESGVLKCTIRIIKTSPPRMKKRRMPNDTPIGYGFTCPFTKRRYEPDRMTGEMRLIGCGKF